MAAPSKKATERVASPAAPIGRNWPIVPQGEGSQSGPAVSPDSGLAIRIVISAPIPRPA